MALKVKAVGHRVIVKPDPVEKKTESGIILQVDDKREAAAAQKGTVFGIGSMAWKNTLYGFGLPGWEPWVKEGDRVFFARYSGKHFVDDETKERYIVMNDEDIQCLIVEETITSDDEDK